MKWFADEGDDDVPARALQQLSVAGDIELVAPDILLYETANVLLRKKLFSVPEVREALDLIRHANIAVVVPEVDLLMEAVQIATRTNAKAYDTAYLALANDLACPLVTADVRFAKAAASLGDIRLLNTF